MDGSAGDGEACRVGEVEACGVEGVSDATDGVDEPEVRDAHFEVVAENDLSAGEAVFGGEDFDTDERRGGRDLLMGSVGVKDGDVADADAGGRDADALLDDGVGVPCVFTVFKQSGDKKLNLGVIVCAHVAFLYFAVDEVNVGLVGGAEVLIDGEQSGCGRHGFASVTIMRRNGGNG